MDEASKEWVAELTKEKVIVLLRSTVKECIGRAPFICKECRGFSSKKHQNVWCTKCPGQMIEYPEMTWAAIMQIGYEKRRLYWANGFEWYLASLCSDDFKDAFEIIREIRWKFGPLERLVEEALSNENP